MRILIFCLVASIVQSQPTADCGTLKCGTGYVCEMLQSSNGAYPECVAKMAPANDCASLNCLPGTVCELMQGSSGSFYECVAKMAPVVDCANVKCQAGYVCEVIKNAAGILPECVPVPTSDCSTFKCLAETFCQMFKGSNGAFPDADSKPVQKASAMPARKAKSKTKEELTNEEKFLAEKGLANKCRIAYDEADDEAKAGMKRSIEKILQGDTVHGTGKPEDANVEFITLQNEFENFCKQFPHWAESEQSFVVWRDHAEMQAIEDKTAIQVVRVQNSGLSYMHAPAVLQHYVITKNSGGTHREMLNIAKFIKEYFTPDELYDHIVRNKGGNSVAFLQHIMGLKDKDIESYTIPGVEKMSFQSTAQDVFDSVQEHGVGLVSSFKVDANFHKEGVSFIDTSYDSDSCKVCVFFIIASLSRISG